MKRRELMLQGPWTSLGMTRVRADGNLAKPCSSIE